MCVSQISMYYQDTANENLYESDIQNVFITVIYQNFSKRIPKPIFV